MSGGAGARGGSWPMFRAMAGVGLLGGLLIVSAFELTYERIERNRQAALEAAIFRVLPGAVTSRSFRWVADGDSGRFATADGEHGADLIHAGFDGAGAPVGVAVEATTMGYQDTIHALYGYSPEQGAIVGLEILESKETPGLGDKIVSDEDFRKNFERLAVVLDAAGRALEHAIVAVKHGEKRDPWQVDGITGATISSKAIARLLDESAAVWAPRIAAHRAEFEAAPAAGGEP